MLLSDTDLRNALASKTISITPEPEARQFQPASIDLTLDLTAKVLRPAAGPHRTYSVEDPPKMERIEAQVDGYDVVRDMYIDIEPGGFYLCSTVELIKLSSIVAARVEGRSTLGRLGLTAHVTAGFIDPGFMGSITLEITNLAPWKVRLTHRMRIAQLCVYRLMSPVERLYGHPDLGSKYQGQTNTQIAKKENT